MKSKKAKDKLKAENDLDTSAEPESPKGLDKFKLKTKKDLKKPKKESKTSLKSVESTTSNLSSNATFADRSLAETTVNVSAISTPPSFTKTYDYTEDEHGVTKKHKPIGGFTYETNLQKSKENISDVPTSPSKRAQGLAFNYAPGEGKKVAETAAEKRKTFMEKVVDGIKTPGINYVQSAVQKESSVKKELKTNIGTKKETKISVETKKEPETGVDTKKGSIFSVESQIKSKPGVDSKNESKPGVGSINEFKPGVDSINESKQDVDPKKESKMVVETKKVPITGFETKEGSRFSVESQKQSKPGVEFQKGSKLGVELQKESKLVNEPKKEFKTGVEAKLEPTEEVTFTKTVLDKKVTSASAETTVETEKKKVDPKSGIFSKKSKEHGNKGVLEKAMNKLGSFGKGSKDKTEVVDVKKETSDFIENEQKNFEDNKPLGIGSTPLIVKTTTKQTMIKDKEGVTQNIEEKVEDLTSGEVTVSTQHNKVIVVC